MSAEKFIEPFIDFVNQNFNAKEHIFIVRGDSNFPTSSRPNTIKVNLHINKFLQRILYTKHLYKAEKIILHNIFDVGLLAFIALQPWLLKKCYWIIWGADLYQYKTPVLTLRMLFYEKIRSFAIKRIGHLLTYIPGDVELARAWYGATGKYHECIMYDSNVYRDTYLNKKAHTEINIQIGNSADPSNNHIEILEKLKPFRNSNIAIYSPLSYGDKQYAMTVTHAGITMFGNKFKPILDFVPYAEYQKLLKKIDIAIFAHKRQQGMGNTITLLGLGKKVYMRNDVSQWALFKDLGVEIFDINELDISLLDEHTSKNNNKIISEYFSKEKLIRNYRDIFQ